MKKKPIIGILGGMGTAAGLYFQKIFFETCTQNGITGDQNYPEWIYINASLAPDRTAAITGEGPSPVPYLAKNIKIIQSAGADFVIVTCNTAHTFYKDIISEVDLPWIHLPDVTAQYLKQHSIRQIGITATSGTLSSGIYQTSFKNLDIAYIAPPVDSDIQANIMAAIYNPEYGIKYTGSKLSDKAQQLISKTIDQLNTPNILVGCTELSFATSEMNLHTRIVDPLHIAAQIACNIWLGNRSI